MQWKAIQFILVFLDIIILYFNVIFHFLFNFSDIHTGQHSVELMVKYAESHEEIIKYSTLFSIYLKELIQTSQERLMVLIFYLNLYL